MSLKLQHWLKNNAPCFIFVEHRGMLFIFLYKPATVLVRYIVWNALLYAIKQQHPFNDLFSKTTWISQHQKGKLTILNFNEARDDGVTVASAGYVQIICSSLQTDNHTSTLSLSFYRPDVLPDAQPTVSKHWRYVRALNTITHTHTHTAILRLYRFCPGQPRWDGTRRNIHPLTSIIVINRPLSASSIWQPPCPIHTHDSPFFTISKFSLVYLLAWHPPLHTPYISSPSHFLLFATNAHTITTCFAVVPRLCHLILVSLSTLYLEFSLVASYHSHICLLKCYLISRYDL